MTNRLLSLSMTAGAAALHSSYFGRNGFGHLTSLISCEYFFRVCAHLGARHLIECGANRAETSVEFVQRGLGRATAVEANPDTYRTRTTLAEAHGVQVVNAALGETAGEVVLKVPVSNGTVHEGASSLFSRSEETEYIEHHVRQTTVDEVASSRAADNEGIALWIDVEGLAHQVLSGARQILGSQQIRLIYVEVETIKYWENQYLASDVDRLLGEMGYVPIIRDVQSEHQFNLLYVPEGNLDGCDELILSYWKDFASIKPSSAAVLRLKASNVKRGMLNSAWLGTPVHMLAALLGSQSSRRHLADKLKRD